MAIVIVRVKGGKGSGFFGHLGRPGEGVGGSKPRGSSPSTGGVDNRLQWDKNHLYQYETYEGGSEVDPRAMEQLRAATQPIDYQPNSFKEPGIRIGYNIDSNKWAVSPDAYEHGAIFDQLDPGRDTAKHPLREFANVTGFYNPFTNQIFFYDLTINSGNMKYLAESNNMSQKVVERQIKAAQYHAINNLFKVDGKAPEVFYFSDLDYSVYKSVRKAKRIKTRTVK